MDIFVAGAGGNTGRVVADTLLAAGHGVTVMVRDEAKAASWRGRGARAHVGDLGDTAALTEAMKGSSAAYLLIPPDPGADDVLASGRRKADALAEAVRRSGPVHVVALSSVGAQHAAGNGPIAQLHYLESVLGGAAVTFLRAAYFLENWASVMEPAKGGILPSFLVPDRKFPMIATADIGRFAAAELQSTPAAGKRIIEIAGPTDYSSADIADAMGEVLHHPVTVQTYPASAVVPTLTAAGLPPQFAALVQEMTEGINSGHVSYEFGAPKRGVVTAAEVFGAILGQAGG